MELNIFTLGVKGCGLSSLVRCLCNKNNKRSDSATVKQRENRRNIIVDGLEYRLRVHCLSLQNNTELSPILERSMQRAHAFMLVYNVTKRGSLYAAGDGLGDGSRGLGYWKDTILRLRDAEEKMDVPMVLVGNRGRNGRRKVSSREGGALASSWRCPFVETNNKDSPDVCLEELVRQVLKLNGGKYTKSKVQKPIRRPSVHDLRGLIASPVQQQKRYSVTPTDEFGSLAPSENKIEDKITPPKCFQEKNADAEDSISFQVVTLGTAEDRNSMAGLFQDRNRQTSGDSDDRPTENPWWRNATIAALPTEISKSTSERWKAEARTNGAVSGRENVHSHLPGLLNSSLLENRIRPVATGRHSPRIMRNSKSRFVHRSRRTQVPQENTKPRPVTRNVARTRDEKQDLYTEVERPSSRRNKRGETRPELAYNLHGTNEGNEPRDTKENIVRISRRTAHRPNY